MKILITGGAGFIGSALVLKAIKKKYEVINIDNLTYAGNMQNISNLKNNRNHYFIKADICNEKKMYNIMEKYQPDSIVHLAASSHVDNSIKKPSDFINVNIFGTYSIIEAARKYWINNNRLKKFRFLYISTDEVFGSAKGKSQFTEKNNYSPNNPYSASKASGELIVKSWNKTYGFPGLITNTSNNYGPRQFIEKLIPLTINNCLMEKKIPVYGNGKNIRDWIHVDDNADAILTVLKKGKINQNYNIGSNNEISNIQIVKLICRIIDKKIKKNNSKNLIEFVADRPGHDFRYAIDCSKIKNELGWNPKISFDKGLENTIDWYLDNQKWLKKNQSKLKKI